MRKQDLFRMSLGVYELTDSIENYYYTLTIELTVEEKERCYTIKRKGDIGGSSVFMMEDYVSYDDESFVKYKVLSAHIRVGGLCLHSDDNYSMLSGLRFIPRGSFAEFIERTK